MNFTPEQKRQLLHDWSCGSLQNPVEEFSPEKVEQVFAEELNKRMFAILRSARIDGFHNTAYFLD